MEFLGDILICKAALITETVLILIFYDYQFFNELSFFLIVTTTEFLRFLHT